MFYADYKILYNSLNRMVSSPKLKKNNNNCNKIKIHWHGNATLTRAKLSGNYLFFWTNLTAKMATKELKRMGALAINMQLTFEQLGNPFMIRSHGHDYLISFKTVFCI